MTPAEILLIISMAIAVVFALFLIIVLFTGEQTLHVWGSEQPFKTLEWFLYAITGVWVIKWTMMFSMTISYKAPFWGVGICFFLLLMLALFYVFDVTGVVQEIET